MEKKFLIYIDSFDPSSGGQVALHKLCHDIRSLDREGYITCPQTHSKLNASRPTSNLGDIDNIVVIYPEIVHGNPLQSKHVVRWILNTPGKCGGVGDGFYKHKKDTDLIYKYSPFFEYDGSEDGMLRSTFIDYECFNNKGLNRDVESCFLVKKGGISEIKHDQNSINFSYYQSNWENAAHLLNRCKYFYCYDNECFWVTLAALCGCIPIVIPNTDLTFDQWTNAFPFNKYGISFGLDMISYARETIHKVESHCKDLQREDLENLDLMIKRCDLL